MLRLKIAENRVNWLPERGLGQNIKSHYIHTVSGQSILIKMRVKTMVKVIYEGDDFKRMMRKDMLKLQQLVNANKMGIFEVDYKEGKIKVEIKKKGDDIVVRRYRTM